MEIPKDISKLRQQLQRLPYPVRLNARTLPSSLGRSVIGNIKEMLKNLLEEELGLSLDKFGLQFQGFQRSGDSLLVQSMLFDRREHIDIIPLYFYFNVGEGKTGEISIYIKESPVAITVYDENKAKSLLDIFTSLSRRNIFLEEDLFIETTFYRALRQYLKRTLKKQTVLQNTPYHIDFRKPIEKTLTQGRSDFIFKAPLYYSQTKITTITFHIITQDTHTGQVRILKGSMEIEE